MYEAGPQVLSPVRKPNQVDTVTWDVTREFLQPLASFHSTLSPPLPHTHPALYLVSPVCFPSQSDFQCPSPRGLFFGLSGRTTRRFSYQFIFPFIVSPSKKSTSTGGENKYGESVFMRSLIVAFSAGRDQEKKDKAGVERAREDEERKKYRWKIPRGPRRTRNSLSPCTSPPPLPFSASR